jgi:hypothetical protein
MQESPGRTALGMSSESSKTDRRAERNRRRTQNILDSMPAQIEAIRQAKERDIAHLARFTAALQSKRKSR